MPDCSRDPFGLCGHIVDGRYRVQQLVGQGGFGAVYRALHLGFDGAVALKLLKLPADADGATREAMIASFKHEGRILFELCTLHHSIVQVTDAGVVVLEGRGPVPYLVLEWLDGIALNTALEYRRRAGAGPMSFQTAFRLLHPVSEALAAAHRKGIAHRDVKPANIFLARAGGLVVPKLLDFGIAKVVRDLGTTTEMFQATAQAAPFTALYAAPEQWVRRLGATGTWTDVYAFALVLSELLTGQRPGADGDVLQAMGAALDAAERPTPRARGAEVSEPVEGVFKHAMTVEPRARIRTVASFWSCLAEAAGFAPDIRPAPLRVEDLHWPASESAASVPAALVHTGPTLPTQDATYESSLAHATGGPVVSAAQSDKGSLPFVRPRLSSAAAILSTGMVLAVGAWFATSAKTPPPAVEASVASSPAPKDSRALPSVASSAPNPVPSAPVVETRIVSAPPSLTPGRRGAAARRAPLAQSSTSASPVPPSPPLLEPPEPSADEILKNRR